MNVCLTCKHRTVERNNWECEDCRYRRSRRRGGSPIEGWAKEAATDAKHMSVRRLWISSPEGDPVQELRRLNVELQQLAHK